MNCPACKNVLTEKAIGGITVDICENSCGGIWFDWFELKKLDEPHEEAGNELLEIPRNHDIKVDHSQRIKCPRCVEMIMMRHFYSVKREAEVDECPKCGGYWLDYGELGQIRSQFPTEEARYEAAQKYFDDLFGQQFSHLRLEGEEKVEKVERIMKILKYLCPSYYIPGKQKWGSF